MLVVAPALAKVPLNCACVGGGAQSSGPGGQLGWSGAGSLSPSRPPLVSLVSEAQRPLETLLELRSCCGRATLARPWPRSPDPPRLSSPGDSQAPVSSLGR